MSPESQKMRAEALAKVEKQAEQMLNDERFPWLRSRRGSRTLVVTTILTIIAYTYFSVADMPILALTAILLYGIQMWGLRLATRNVTEWPEEFIDERLQSMRNKVYRYAYLCVGGLLAFFTIWPIIANGFFDLEVTGILVSEVTFGLFFFMIVCPSMIYAWIKVDE